MMFDSLIRLIAWTQKDSYSSLEQALSVSAEKWNSLMTTSGIQNYVILSTCNRLEIYYASQEELSEFPHEGSCRKLSGSEALRHLFRVTAGLESMSVGESEILHQVKEAFDSASGEGHVGSYLALIFRRALSSGKLVRRKTQISRGKVSIPALSMDIVSRRYGVEGKRIAVVGTGKMATDILKYIQKLAPSCITILGRSRDKAESLAAAFDASWKVIGDLPEAIRENDIIVTATSAKNVIVDRQMVNGTQGARTFLDISNPRNVEEPLESDSYELIDLASLNPILEKNRSMKVNEIEAAGNIVKEQVEAISARLSGIESEEIIGKIYKHAEELRKHELSRFKKALAAGTDFDKALEAMSTAIVNKLLASQNEVLRGVHGERLTTEILSAVEKAYSRKSPKTSSKESQDHQDTQSQQDQTPQLSQKP